MSKIVFDPELMQHIKTIYGEDADLDERTLRQIYNTWKANPEYIRNTAYQKTRLNNPSIEATVAPSSMTAPQVAAPQLVLYHDLSNIANFNLAFAEARKRGLKTFKWKGTKGNPSGLFGTLIAETNTLPEVVVTASKKLNEKDNREEAARMTLIVDAPPVSQAPTTPNLQEAPQSFPNIGRVPGKGARPYTFDAWYEENFDLSPRSPYNYQRDNVKLGFLGLDVTKELIDFLNSTPPKGNRWMSAGKYQQGGTMNNQEELQKAFMAYLIQDAAAQGVQLQSEQDLQAYAQLLGEEGIKAKYQEFMQRMQGGVMARLGAKLNYYKKLKGVCPEGEELVYFKLGGRICKACQKSKKEQLNEVEQFKAARCGAKMKKKK